MLQLTISHIYNENEECKMYVFDVKRPVRYKAGQFLTVFVTINQTEHTRSYSLTSTPGVDNHLSIAVRRIQNGIISRHIFDHWQVGQTIKALPPAGMFTINHSAELYFFVAAGSGITPIFALLKQVLLVKGGTAVLVYQNTHEDRSIFRSELQQLQLQFPRHFEMIELFSKPHNKALMPQRLNNHSIEKIVLDKVHTCSVQFYICGPKLFMLVIGFTLRVLGYRDEQIHRENFTIAKVPPPPQLKDTGRHKVVVNYQNQQYQFGVNWPQNILEAALQNKIPLPYSCRGGICSSCMAHCVSGKITMSKNELLTPADVEKGIVLTCVAYPQTDVELDYPMAEE